MGDLGFTLVPPEGWQEIRLDPGHREQQLIMALAPMSSIVPNWVQVYPQVRRQLAGAYAQAWDGGVRYAIATRPDPIGVANIMATYMVAVLPPADPLNESDLDAIQEMLAEEQGSLLQGESQDLSYVNLPYIGKAIQAASVKHLSDGVGNSSDAYVATLRTFIPVRDSVIVATGITPQVDLADVLFQLFAHITSTLQIHDISEHAI
jgi:hypothetical protein